MKTIEECRKQFGQVWTTEVEGVGEFHFRKPTAREWVDFDEVRVTWIAAIKSGSVTRDLSHEFFVQCEDLCTRCVVSHTPEELHAVNDEYLGIFRDVALEIASTIDALRAKTGKGSPPSGTARPAGGNTNA